MRATTARTLAYSVVVLACLMAEAIGDDGRPNVRDFPDEYEAPVMRAWRGGLHPLYFPMMAFYSPAMMLGYFWKEGIMASMMFTLLFLVILIFIYQFAFLGHDGSYVRMWQYPMPNLDSILSNRGAIGGFYFVIANLGTALLGGLLGDSVSWAGIDTVNGGLPSGGTYTPRQRTYNAGSLTQMFRRGCGGFLCPNKVNDEMGDVDAAPAPAYEQTIQRYDRNGSLMGEKQTYVAKNTKMIDEATGNDQTTCFNSFTATAGNRITFGVFVDIMTSVSIIGLVVGPIRDAMREVHVLYDWFTLLVLLGAFAIIWYWYQPYEYGDTIDYPAWKFGPTGPKEELDADKYVLNNKRIYLRYYNKLHQLYPIFVYIFVVQLGFCIFSSVMWGMHAYERAQTAQDSGEARYIVRQNLMMEFITVIIITGILFIPSILEYCLLKNGNCKRPAIAKKSDEMETGGEVVDD